MPIQTKSLSLNLESKPLTYPDDFYSLKGVEITPSNSFSYFEYEALKNPEDVKTNNFSNLIITKKDLTSNWLKSNIKTIENDISMVSTISYTITDKNNKKQQQYWLYFDKEQKYATQYAEAQYSITTVKPSDVYDNYLFYIEFLPNSKCKISHTFSDIKYYLSYENDIFSFLKNPKNNSNIFSYVYQDSLLKIIKTVTNENDEEKYKIMGIKIINDFITLSLEDDINSKNNFINVKNIVLDYDFHIDNSFVKYDKSLGVQSISSSSSAFSLSTQYLIHHEYSNDSDVNFIQLKNNHTYVGNSVRGETLEKPTNINYPTVNHRAYNSISSGINQEYGNDNIILTFTFHDQEFTIEDGEDLIIRIPSKEENYSINPIYPYKQLNIKDTTFIQSGAFGTDVPYFSDRFKKMQLDGVLDNELHLDNATYLCTWLHKENEESEPEWLDRWYYPDKVSRKTALKANCYKQSYYNVLDSVYKNYSDIDKQLLENGYFDKKSDLVIEPNSQYKYSRISSDDVTTILDDIEKYRIRDVFTQNITKSNIKSNLKLNGKNYRFIKGESFNKTNAINLNFDLYIDPKKDFGIQLFGADYKQGFNIQNRKDLAPFHYYASSGVVYLLNNQYEVKHSFNIYEKYNETIHHLVLGDLFEDIMVITKTVKNDYYFYIFSYDLSLKSKFNVDKIDFDNYSNPSSTKALFENSIKQNNKSLVFKNNNLYLVRMSSEKYSSVILKLVIKNDTKIDNNYNKADDKIAFLRNLKTSEYYSCFGENNDSIIEDSTTNEFKNLYFNKHGELFALNYDKIAIGIDDDTCYGIYKSQDNGWYFVYGQSLSKIKTSVDSSGFKLFGSPNSIDFVKINTKGDFALIRGFDESNESEEDSDDNEEEIQEKKLEIYDKSKNLYYSTSLNIFDSILSLDTYTYIDNDVEKCVFSIIGTSGDEANSLIEMEYVHGEYDTTTRGINDILCMNKVRESLVVELANNTLDRNNILEGYEKNSSAYKSWKSYYDNKINKIKEEIAKCEPHLLIDNFYQSTNSDSIVKYTNDKNLYFNLFLPNDNIFLTKLTRILDYSLLESGWYNFNIVIDLDNAIFEVKINDEKIENGTVNAEKELFKKYTNSTNVIFNSNYYIGCLGKQYGITLNDILQNNFTFDPYICKDTEIRNIILFNKILKYYEYIAMRLEDRPIQPLTILLPCGSRSMIEEIIRYFRFNIPTSMSNKVKINIGGIKDKIIKTKGEYTMLAKEILNAIEENSDTLVDVKEIEFI